MAGVNADRKRKEAQSTEGSPKATKAKKAKKVKAPLPDPVTERDPAPRAPAPDADARLMKIISWNVDGLRAAGRREALAKIVDEESPDVICLQETKLQEDHVTAFSDLLPGFAQYWSCSTVKGKLGQAGTAIFTRAPRVESAAAAAAGGDTEASEPPAPKQKTLSHFFQKPKASDDTQPTSKNQAYDGPVVKSVENSIGEQHDGEGRALTVNFEDFSLVALYVPNSGRKLERLDYRLQKWNPDLQAYCDGLGKPVVVTGDLNVAHRDLDIYNYFAPHVPKGAGTTPQEREAFTKWLESGYVDAFAHLHPDARGHYTYWSTMTKARAVNRGLRLDYFVLSSAMCQNEQASSSGAKQQQAPQLHDCYVLNSTTTGVSDHAPIVLQLKL